MNTNLKSSYIKATLVIKFLDPQSVVSEHKIEKKLIIGNVKIVNIGCAMHA
jgi:hypothetical protein